MSVFTARYKTMLSFYETEWIKGIDEMQIFLPMDVFSIFCDFMSNWYKKWGSVSYKFFPVDAAVTVPALLLYLKNLHYIQ